MWEFECGNHATPQLVFERHLDGVFGVRTFGAVPFPIWPEPRRGPVAAFARQTFSLIRTEEQRGKRDRRRMDQRPETKSFPTFPSWTSASLGAISSIA